MVATNWPNPSSSWPDPNKWVADLLLEAEVDPRIKASSLNLAALVVDRNLMIPSKEYALSDYDAWISAVEVSSSNDTAHPSSSCHHPSSGRVFTRLGFEIRKIVEIAYMPSNLSGMLRYLKPSASILQRSWNAIRLYPEYSLLWSFRELLLETLGADLVEELNLVAQLVKRNPNMQEIWLYRQTIVHKIGTSAASCELELTEEILSVDSKIYYAWEHRQWVVDECKVNVMSELEFTERMLNKDARSYNVWTYRRHLVEDEITSKELEFTVPFLEADARNEYAWCHRQWVLLKIGGWQQEFAFCDAHLLSNIYNESAWNQRLFASNRSELGGLKPARVSQVEYALRAIYDRPDNECPWRYFRHFYKNCEDDNKKLEAFCIYSLVVEPSDRIYDRADLFLCGRQYVNALDCVLDLISRGYRPSYQMGSVIINLGRTIDFCEMNPPRPWDEILFPEPNILSALLQTAPQWKWYSYKIPHKVSSSVHPGRELNRGIETNHPRSRDEISVYEFFESICSILQYVAPFGMRHHWRWYTDRVLSSVSDEGVFFWNDKKSVKSAHNKFKKSVKSARNNFKKSEKGGWCAVIKVKKPATVCI